MKFIGIALIIYVCLILFFRFLGYLIIGMNFWKRIKKKPYQKDYRCFKNKGIDIQTGRIYSNSNLLYSYLFHINGREGRRVVVLVKGHGCFAVDYQDIIIQLIEQGYDVFTYDVTGTGNSEGRSPRGYQQWIIDLEAALKEIETQYKDIYLLGHSLGGYAATAVLQTTNIPVRAVVAVSSINSGTEYAKYLYDCIPNIFTKQIKITMRNYEKKKFGKYAEYTGLSGINSTDVPVLVIHSKADKMVPLKCSIAGYEEQITNSFSKVINLETGGHELLKYSNVREIIIEFFQKHL